MKSTNILPTLPDVFFHGSAVAFKRIDVTKGRGRKDFGQGFYMAFSAAQAVGMMYKKFRESISRRRDRSGDFCETLYRIEIDTEFLKTLRVKTFCSADVEWLDHPGSFGGHKPRKGGHRRVSGLVRASLKEELHRHLKEELL